MLDLSELGRRREQLVQMASPPRRVLAAAKSARGAPVKHGLDAAAQPARGFWCLVPKRLKHFQHVIGVDRRDAHLIEYRAGKVLKRLLPLPSMLVSGPSRASPPLGS